jgi:hypothetical protein
MTNKLGGPLCHADTTTFKIKNDQTNNIPKLKVFQTQFFEILIKTLSKTPELEINN